MSAEFLEEDLPTRAKRPRREKDSSRAAVRGFRAHQAFTGRLSRPGYVAACHSRKPEAMVKVVPGAPRGWRVRQLLHYVARTENEPLGESQVNGLTEPQNVWIVDDAGRSYTTRAEVELLAQRWGEEFRPEFRRMRELQEERRTIRADMSDGTGGKGKSQERLDALELELRKLAQKARSAAQSGRKTRDVQHLVLSAKSENTPQNQLCVLAAAQRTARAQFSNYEYVIGLHQDAKHPHAHIIVKCQPKDHARAEGYGKLRTNKPELMQLRTIWARELTREGLEHVATLRQDRPHVMQEVYAGRAELKSKSKNWYTASIEGMAEGLEFVTKRQEDLNAALDRAAGQEEARKIRYEIGQRINDLRGVIRQKTQQGEKARFDAMNELRKIERALKAATDPKLRFRELAEKAGPHKPVYEHILKAVEAGTRLRPSSSASTIREQQQAYAAYQASMSSAWAELRKGGLPREEFSTAAKVLALHDEAMRKSFGLEPMTKPLVNLQPKNTDPGQASGRGPKTRDDHFER